MQAVAAELSYRRGLLPWLTVEAHGEGSGDVGMGGVGAVISVANFAIVSAAVARSESGGMAGSQYAVGLEHVNRIFSFSASTQIADAGFRDLASVSGDVPQRRLDRANIGVTAGRWGSVGVAYAGIRSQDENVKLVSLSYSLRLFAGVSAFISAFHDLAQSAGTGPFSIGLDAVWRARFGEHGDERSKRCPARDGASLAVGEFGGRHRMDGGRSGWPG